MSKKKDYYVQVNPSEKLTGSERVLAGLFIYLFILTVTVNFLLLAVKCPKILVLAVTPTPPSRPSCKLGTKTLNYSPVYVCFHTVFLETQQVTKLSATKKKTKGLRIHIGRYLMDLSTY